MVNLNYKAENIDLLKKIRCWEKCFRFIGLIAYLSMFRVKSKL